MNFQLDPLWQLKSKITVQNYYDLSKILENKKQLTKQKRSEYLNFANNYYKPVNYSKIRKIF